MSTRACVSCFLRWRCWAASGIPSWKSGKPACDLPAGEMLLMSPLRLRRVIMLQMESPAKNYEWEVFMT